jgi:competence protein ComEA
MALQRGLICIGLFALVVSAAVAAQTPLLAQPPASTQSARSRFPDGPGRDALFKVCNDCHGPESVLGHLKTPEEWSKTLDEMSANGATGTDEEWNQILEYLVTHYSLIFVNRATATDLVATLDVPRNVADKIVQARTEKGITSIDDLKQVAGGDAAPKIDARKDRLVF